MSASQAARATRRAALAAGFGALVAAATSSRAGNAAPTSIKFTGGGIAGGGAVKLADGEAHLSLFLTRFNPENGLPIFVGRVQWVDASKNIAIETIEVNDYGPVPGQANARFAVGRVSVNGEGNFQLRLRVVDAGPPGSGADTIEIEVTASSGEPRYAASGALLAGDFELLTFNFDV